MMTEWAMLRGKCVRQRTHCQARNDQVKSNHQEEEYDTDSESEHDMQRMMIMMMIH